jgi:hypothetical protein
MLPTMNWKWRTVGNLLPAKAPWLASAFAKARFVSCLRMAEVRDIAFAGALCANYVTFVVVENFLSI